MIWTELPSSTLPSSPQGSYCLGIEIGRIHTEARVRLLTIYLECKGLTD